MELAPEVYVRALAEAGPDAERGKSTCVRCSHTRRKARQRCAVVERAPEGIRVFCHHCGCDQRFREPRHAAFEHAFTGPLVRASMGARG